MSTETQKNYFYQIDELLSDVVEKYKIVPGIIKLYMNHEKDEVVVKIEPKDEKNTIEKILEKCVENKEDFSKNLNAFLAEHCEKKEL